MNSPSHTLSHTHSFSLLDYFLWMNFLSTFLIYCSFSFFSRHSHVLTLISESLQGHLIPPLSNDNKEFSPKIRRKTGRNLEHETRPKHYYYYSFSDDIICLIVNWSEHDTLTLFNPNKKAQDILYTPTYLHVYIYAHTYRLGLNEECYGYN